MGESPMGSGSGSGAVQDGAMCRKALKVAQHAVRRLPYGTLDWLHTVWERPDAAEVAEGSSLPSRA